MIVFDDLCCEVFFSYDFKVVMYFWRIFRRVKFDIIYLYFVKVGIIGRIVVYYILLVIYIVYGWVFIIGVSKKRVLLVIVVERVL